MEKLRGIIKTEKLMQEINKAISQFLIKNKNFDTKQFDAEIRIPLWLKELRQIYESGTLAKIPINYLNADLSSFDAFTADFMKANTFGKAWIMHLIRTLNNRFKSTNSI